MLPRHEYALKTWGAQVLSQLIWIFDAETPEEIVTTAISALDDFCAKAPENIEETVSLKHTKPHSQLMGYSV